MAIDFEKHRRDLESNAGRVKCAHCDNWIEMRATRCPKCGVHFRGDAFQFAARSDDLETARANRRRRLGIAAAIVALLFTLGVALFFMQ